MGCKKSKLHPQGLSKAICCKRPALHIKNILNKRTEEIEEVAMNLFHVKPELTWEEVVVKATKIVKEQEEELKKTQNRVEKQSNQSKQPKQSKQSKQPKRGGNHGKGKFQPKSF